MKRIISIVFVLFILLNIPILAQGTVIYLPLILKEGETSSMIGLQASFENTDTPSTGQVPITTGPVVFLPGYLGQSRQIARVTTNLITNPSVEVNLTGYAVRVPAAGVHSRVAINATYGSWGSQFDYTSNINGIYFLLTLTPATVYTFSADFIAAAGQPFILRVFDVTGGAFLATTATFTSTGVVQRPALTFTTTANAAFGVYLHKNGGDNVGTFWTDAWQVEQSAFPTSYCDGSLQNHTWNGAAHASSSTRLANSLCYTNPINPPEGFVQFWWKSAADQDGPTRYFFDTDTLAAYFDSFDNKIKFTDGFHTVSTNALTFSADTWQQLKFSWRQGHKAIYQNSILLVEDNNYTPPDGSGYFFVGTDVSRTNHLDGLIDELLVSPIQATPIQPEPTVTPVLCPQTAYNQWQIVQPVESTNYVLNPSGETTLNYSALGGATVTRSTTYQKYGLYSYRVQTGNNGQGLSLTLSALGNTNHFATARIRGQLPNKTKFIIGTGIRTPVLISKIDSYWSLYGMAFNASESNGRTEFRIIQQGEGIGDFYVDGVQVEPLPYWTTYIDGTQEGCTWNGTENASTSTRSGLSLAGGQLKDFYEDYGFFVERIIGGGAPPQSLNTDEYATLPGGELNSIKILPRDMSLVGKFITDDQTELNDLQQALHLALSTENYPGNQSLRLIYSGGKVQKEIKVNYKGGLEGETSAYYRNNFSPEGDDGWVELDQWIEKASIQFQAVDPYWYEVGESAASLDGNDSATFRLVAGRLKSAGQWSNLGPPAIGGTYTQVLAIAEDADYIYIGGIFSNFDNIANADNIVRWHKRNQVYSAMSTGANNTVRSIVIGPDGSVYAAGLFTTIGGVAANRVAKWNPVTETWSTLGVGMNDAVYTLAVGLNGLLYAGGDFTTAGGAARSHIAYWDNTTWSDMAGGTNAVCTVNIIKIGPSGLVYVGGDSITTLGAVVVSNIGYWNPSTLAWSDMAGGTNGEVHDIAISPDEIVYIGGSFTTAGGNTANRTAEWNGTSWKAMGSGMNAIVWSMAIGSDNIVYAGGFFSTADGISLNDRISRWSGSNWIHLDIDLPSTPVVYEIFISKYADPIVPQNYDIYLGGDVTVNGTGYFAGKTTVTNDGNVLAFPQVIYKRTGGTTITIETLKNETTGKELLFDYDLLDGEKLTITLTPAEKSVISNYFGSRWDAILANSDTGTWTLKPGSNDITTFAADPNVSLYPSSLTAYLLWRDKYKSFH